MIDNHIHEEYITTPEFNNLATNVLNTRLSQVNFMTKTEFDAKS